MKSRSAIVAYLAYLYANSNSTFSEYAIMKIAEELGIQEDEIRKIAKEISLIGEIKDGK